MQKLVGWQNIAPSWIKTSLKLSSPENEGWKINSAPESCEYDIQYQLDASYNAQFHVCILNTFVSSEHSFVEFTRVFNTWKKNYVLQLLV